MDTKKKILIIENDVDMRSVYTELLTSAGYEVIQTTNIIDSVNTANNGNWDLMLLENDATILNEIEKNSHLKEKPFILLTNLGKDSTVNLECNMEPRGCLDYLDSSPREVIDLVNSILN